MTAKTLLFHGQARAKMLAGMNVLANAVRGTLGPRARTVVLERSYGAPTIINSGVLVAKEAALEERGRAMLALTDDADDAVEQALKDWLEREW